MFSTRNICIVIPIVLLILITGCAQLEQMVNVAPTASIKADRGYGEAPLTVGFNASESYDPDGSIESYHWSFGDGQSTVTYRPTATVTHTFSDDSDVDNNGDNEGFKVTVTVTDNEGAISMNEAYVRVYVMNPKPVANFTYSPHNPKVGEEVVFNASGSYDVAAESSEKAVPEWIDHHYGFQWDLDNDGYFEKRGIRVTHRFTYPGSYPVTLRVTDDDGDSSDITKEVRVQQPNQAPVAKFSYRLSDTVNCESAGSNKELKVSSLKELEPEIIVVQCTREVYFNGTQSYDPDPGDHIAKFSWHFGDNTIVESKGPQVSHKYAFQCGRSYNATLEVFDSHSASSSQTKKIWIDVGAGPYCN